MSYKCEHGKDSDICVQCWEESNLEPPQQHVDELNKNADLIGGRFVESATPRTDALLLAQIRSEKKHDDWLLRLNEIIPFTHILERELEETKQQLSQSGIELLRAASEKAELFKQLETSKELIENLVHALKCANNSYCGSPDGQSQITHALNLAHSQGYGVKEEK